MRLTSQIMKIMDDLVVSSSRKIKGVRFRKGFLNLRPPALIGIANPFLAYFQKYLLPGLKVGDFTRNTPFSIISALMTIMTPPLQPI